MSSKYVLITTEIDTEGEVIEEIKKFPEVVESYLVFGVYDILAKIEAKTMLELNNVINLKFKHLQKIRSIKSLTLA